MAGMSRGAADVDRYRDSLAGLIDRKHWYDTADGLHYAAVVCAVDGLDPPELRRHIADFRSEVKMSDRLAPFRPTAAAILLARGLDLSDALVAIDDIQERLRPVTRPEESRRVAALIAATTSIGVPAERADRILGLYRDWKARHRVLSGSVDLPLAAASVGVEPDTARGAHDAEVIHDELSRRRYRHEWRVARVLALAGTDAPLHRFMALVEVLRGRRRRPLSHRRASIAVAALSAVDARELVDILPASVKSMRRKPHRAEPNLALSLAATLTLGSSGAADGDHRLRTAFHGLVLAEQFAQVRQDRE